MSTTKPKSTLIFKKQTPSRKFQYNKEWLSQKQLHDIYNLDKEAILQLPIRKESEIRYKINRKMRRVAAKLGAKI